MAIINYIIVTTGNDRQTVQTVPAFVEARLLARIHCESDQLGPKQSQEKL